MLLDVLSLPELHTKIMGGDDFTVRDMRNMLCASREAYRVQTNNTQLNSKLKKLYSTEQLQHATALCNVPQNIIGSGLLARIVRAIKFSTGDLELTQKWLEILGSPYGSGHTNTWPVLDGLEHASTLQISQTGLIQAILLSMDEFQSDIVVQVMGTQILYKVLAECVVFHPIHPRQSVFDNCRVLDEPLRIQMASMVMSACMLGDTWKNKGWRYHHKANGMYLLLLLISQSTECHHAPWCSLLPLSRKLGNGNVQIISDLVEKGCIESLTNILKLYAGLGDKRMFGYDTMEHARAINEHVLVLSHIVMHSPANLKRFVEAKCVHVLLNIYLSFYLKLCFLHVDEPDIMDSLCFLLDTTLYHICVVLLEYASTTEGSRELLLFLKKIHGFNAFPRLVHLREFPYENLHQQVNNKSTQLSDLVNSCRP